MNKAQLTDAVAAATDTSKAEAGRAVEATLNAIAGSLAGGDSVSLVGFRNFQRKAQSCQNRKKSSNWSNYTNSRF